jgi:antagonist of KipI
MTVVVKRAGMFTTVQDLGRYGYQRYGVSVSGAMDAYACACANILVGNPPGAATLELTVSGPVLTFTEPCVIAICGADMKPVVQEDGDTVPMWRPVYVSARTTITFGTAKSGVRTYIAFAGGVRAESKMGSCSTYVRAGIGGIEGRTLRDGDVLAIGAPTALGQAMAARLGARLSRGVAAPPWHVGWTAMPHYDPEPVVRFIPGMHYDRFADDSLEAFTRTPYRLSPQSDRMGFRLSGARLSLKRPEEFLSEPVTLGTVQVPPDGQPIILMADRQTTGGYPVIAQIIGADMPVVAQTPIGGSMRFVRTDVGEAERAWFRQQEQLRMIQAAVAAYMHRA